MNKIIWKYIICLTLLAAILAGCGKSPQSVSATQDTLLDGENPFASPGGDSSMPASLAHGPKDPVTDSNGYRMPYTYTGGEFQLSYYASVTGSHNNMGFLIYLDGIPQPYKVDDGAYEYIHIFQMEDGQDTIDFSFSFTPVTGTVGETLPLTIVSLYNPAFRPDMVNTSAYGMFHSTLDMNLQLTVSAAPDPGALPDLPTINGLSSLTVENVPLTGDLLDTLSNTLLGDVSQDSLDTNVISRLLLDSTEVMDNMAMTDGTPIHLSYTLCGVPGARYVTTFYANHQPIFADGRASTETILEKGSCFTIEADINPAQLDDFTTFYAVSVPTNTDDFPNAIVTLLKTPSILLYKAGAVPGSGNGNISASGLSDANKEGSASNAPAAPSASGQDLTAGAFETPGIQGKIHSIYDGGNGAVIIFADKMYLYDPKACNVLAEAPLPCSYIASAQPIPGGYAVLGEGQSAGGSSAESSGSGITGSSSMTAGDGDGSALGSNSSDMTSGNGATSGSNGAAYGTQVIYYDSSLAKTRRISISDLASHEHSLQFSDPAAISSGGGQLAYAINGDGLYVYDTKSQKATKVMDYNASPEALSGLVSVTQLAFADNDKTLVFTAASNDVPLVPDRQTHTTCGRVGVDGSGFMNLDTDDFEIYEMIGAADGLAFFCEDFRSPTGRMLKMNTADGSLGYLNFTDPEESSMPNVSTDGSFYASSVLKGNAWNLRIYETATGGLVTEQSITAPAEVYTYRNPVALLTEQLRTAFILMGQSQTDYETRAYILPY